MTTTTHDVKYLELVDDVLRCGTYKPNRTGIGTYSTFAKEMRFDLRDGTIPLLTTKKMHTRSIFHEIIWYLSGDTNIKYLKDNNVTIWDEWADENGNLGPVYGKQWRRWSTKQLVPGTYLGYHWIDAHHKDIEIDQISNLINTLRKNPNDRRLLVSAWNVGELNQMALPPCHYSFQFYAKPLSYHERIVNAKLSVYEAGTPREELERLLNEINEPTYELSMLLNQRSCDVGLGVPFNIAQYSTLLRMVAQVVNMAPGEFIWRGGDVHIYENHVEALREQLTRAPYPSPRLLLDPSVKEIDDFKFNHFNVVGYQSYPAIKMDVAV